MCEVMKKRERDTAYGTRCSERVFIQDEGSSADRIQIARHGVARHHVAKHYAGFLDLPYTCHLRQITSVRTDQDVQIGRYIM